MTRHRSVQRSANNDKTNELLAVARESHNKKSERRLSARRHIPATSSLDLDINQIAQKQSTPNNQAKLKRGNARKINSGSLNYRQIMSNKKRQARKKREKNGEGQAKLRYDNTRDDIVENDVVHCPAFTAPLIDFGFEHNDSDNDDYS